MAMMYCKIGAVALVYIFNVILQATCLRVACEGWDFEDILVYTYIYGVLPSAQFKRYEPFERFYGDSIIQQ